jgi:hypothetical protein
VTSVEPGHAAGETKTRSVSSVRNMRGDGPLSASLLLAFPSRKENSRTHWFELAVLMTGLFLLAISAVPALTGSGRATIPRDLASSRVKPPSSETRKAPELDQQTAALGRLEVISTASISRAVPLPPVPTAVMVEPSLTTPNDAPATESPETQKLKLSAEEVGTYLRRAETALKGGDIVGARLLFSHLALAGDSRGALGMAKTFDPEELRKLGVYGVRADSGQAVHWKVRARELSSEN